MTDQLVPRLPRRKKQPTAAKMRETIAQLTDEIMRKQAEINALKAARTPWYRRLLGLGAPEPTEPQPMRPEPETLADPQEIAMPGIPPDSPYAGQYDRVLVADMLRSLLERRSDHSPDAVLEQANLLDAAEGRAAAEASR